MAVNVHIAHVGFYKVSSDTGAVLTKDDPTETIKQHLRFSQQHRVIADSTIPNTANYPTVDAYIELEAASDFVVQYMDQYTIITYKRNSTGGFPS